MVLHVGLNSITRWVYDKNISISILATIAELRQPPTTHEYASSCESRDWLLCMYKVAFALLRSIDTSSCLISRTCNENKQNCNIYCTSRQTQCHVAIKQNLVRSNDSFIILFYWINFVLNRFSTRFNDCNTNEGFSSYVRAETWIGATSIPLWESCNFWVSRNIKCHDAQLGNVAMPMLKWRVFEVIQTQLYGKFCGIFPCQIQKWIIEELKCGAWKRKLKRTWKPTIKVTLWAVLFYCCCKLM